jgi:GTP-binding protein
VLIETMRREGLRACRVASARRHAEGREPATCWSRSRKSSSTSTRSIAGVVVQKMSERKAEMVELRPSGGNRQRLVFHAPTRGLIGYQSELLTDTRGTAVMNRLFHAYSPTRARSPAAPTAC